MSVDLENQAYFAVYVLYLIYGLYNLLSVRTIILNNFIDNGNEEVGFVDGFLGTKRDDSNDELENFNSFLQKWWMWYVVHVIVSLLFTKFCPQRRSLGHAFACVLGLLCTVKLLFVAILVCQLLTYYAISMRPSKKLTWSLSLIWMFVINVIKNSEMWYTTLGYSEYFMLLLTLSWSLLRCCSFVLTKLKEKPTIGKLLDDKYSMESFFGYTLYFPCIAHGPFLSFDRYIMTTDIERKGIGLKLRTLCFQLLRVAIWWCVLHVALHFLYIHYMARNIAAVKLIKPIFGQHAIGYFMGQFFFLYYVITYGVGIAFANFDELRPPNPPRCIGCIHSYADMWKYFDEGLYEFLFLHIYAQICRKDSNMLLKLFATAATFAFVFVWHGCYTYVLVWSALNFSCLVAEKIFKAIVLSRTYQHFTASHLSQRNAQRLYALLATQLFIPAAFSNVYFISGMDVGNYLMRGAYRSGIWNFLALSFCSYCFFQCAEVIAQRRQLDAKSNGRL